MGILAVKDRIVQTAVKRVIEPILEKEFWPTSYGFRPSKGCKDALREVAECLKQGYTHVVVADLKGYFDSIPHELLKARIEEHISDGRLLQLLASWLQKDIVRDLERWTPTADEFILRRLRSILRKQEKRPGMGRCYEDHRRWPNAYFANLGLFTMTQAHHYANQPR